MKFYRRFFDSDPRLARFSEIRRDEVVSEPTTYLPRVWQPDLSQPACSKNHPRTKAAEEHPLSFTPGVSVPISGTIPMPSGLRLDRS